MVPSALAGTRLRAILSGATRDAVVGLRHLDQPGIVRDLLSLVTVGAIFGAPFITLMPVHVASPSGISQARTRLGVAPGGRAVVRGVKQKMSNFQLRPRGRQPTRFDDYTPHIITN